ncbi:MAG: glyoxalase [Lachnospiraceae bacterium]|nr:glyoxalase [Lachnospiraceae bacterium]
MGYYSKQCIDVFLENQKQLFDKPVASTPEEAQEFLEDCMAAVAGSLKEVQAYLEEGGMDVSGLSPEELAEMAEVFPLGDGTYLIVEA